MKTSLITLAAILMLSLNSNAQNLLASLNDIDPVVNSVAKADDMDDMDVIIRQMAYPIPTYDFVSLELKGKANTSVRIRVEDTSGDELYELFKVVDLDPDYVGRIDMRGQERAIYFIIVETPDGDELSRMQIEKR